MIPGKELRQKFYNTFRESGEPVQIFFSPGRLCLIGEHIDYNGGLVLPAAISLGIYAVIRPNNSGIIKIISEQEELPVTIDLSNEIQFQKERGWGNYPAGVLKYMLDRGHSFKGAEVLFVSDLPAGSGLSSSAAIEVLTGFAFHSLNAQGSIDKLQLAQLCKSVENDFIGVECGIMDQFAVAMGKRDHAMLLDCNSLEFEYVPVKLNDYAIVIFNTNKKRELAESIFNVRVQECSRALQSIRAYRKVENLPQATIEQVNQWVDNPAARKRALHVVAENKRVTQAAHELANMNLKAFGELLFQSHDSLRSLYEVTGRELDAIVDAAKKRTECIGAKMSGAGFGGCAYAVVERDKADAFIGFILRSYKIETSLKADYYFAGIDDGVRKLKD